MGRRDLAELVLLAALWGASFLFMRVAAPVFGPLVLVLVRVGLATLCLLPLVCWRSEARELMTHWRPLAVVGLLNSALPFSLFAWAALSLSAGFTAVLNATTPLWGAVVAWLWLATQLPRGKVLGLALGFLGVVVLVWGRISFKPGGDGWAVLAAMLAPVAYGIAANYTKQKLAMASPLVVATGSQLAATLMLLPLAVPLWPEHPISLNAWLAAIALAVVCTALAFLLFFRLIAKVGPGKAIAVTFLIPLFAIVWGGIFLGETLTAAMAAGGGIILLGIALALGLWSPRWLAPAKMD
ncbi:multidrug DMT transporter permease [Chitinimonas prasina]|uniref:Multidrug DMT transporter permease n=1 Tax=Chitinimonas prasina TaxID=1434937 RepID=A0ABQ5YI52_9NEIS|nr:DMT family transporter [Chitinimonas prasina]GLR13347.1 multidrug DMT transporter permease [Chitinimonas prasina]